MGKTREQNKQEKIEEKIKEKVKKAEGALEKVRISKDYDKSLQTIKSVFEDIDTIMFKEFTNFQDRDLRFCLISARGMVDPDLLSNNVIKPLMENELEKSQTLAEDIAGKILYIPDVKPTSDLKKIVEGVTYGDSALLISGSNKLLLIGAKKYPTRSVTEPESEKIIKGPKEGFTECVISNLTMMHRKIRSNDFKIKLFSCGETSNTQMAVCYMNSYVNKKILKLLLKKIKQAEFDNILDSNYISEMIRDKKWSPFRTVGTTERPDSLAGKILEGRIGIFVDGSPVALTVPRLFIENFQSPEDYYTNFYYASFARLLRILAFFIGIATPAIYIAIVAYHHEMLPTNLLINITIERQTVPLPAALECFLMLLVFDILRETGVRMPQGVGQAMSIVGALVIGQAAVEAKLVAAPMIIVVALTGITSLLVPKLSGAIIFCRFFLLALASMLGFVGVVIGFSLIMIHLINLNSFGVPQFSPISKVKAKDLKDMYVRAPIASMKQSEKSLSNKKTGILKRYYD